MKKLLFPLIAIMMMATMTSCFEEVLPDLIATDNQGDLPSELRDITKNPTSADYEGYINQNLLNLAYAVTVIDVVTNHNTGEVTTTSRTYYKVAAVTHWGKSGRTTYVSKTYGMFTATEAKVKSIQKLINDRSKGGKEGSVIIDFESNEISGPLDDWYNHYRIIKGVR